MSTPQQQVVSLIDDGGSTYEQIADELDITNSTARDHVSRLRTGGEAIGSVLVDGKKQFYYRKNRGQHPTNNPTSHPESTRNKRQKTKKLKQHYQDLEARLEAGLSNSKPVVADGRGNIVGEQDAVIHRSDAHFGDYIEGEFGELQYSPEITEQRERYVLEKSIQRLEEQESIGVEFDTIHLLLGGDMVTNEQTYQNQQADIVQDAEEQLDDAYEIYLEYIQRLSDRFPKVQVVCQSGNHGEIDPTYSDKANLDRFLFMFLEKGIGLSDMDNVTFIRGNSTVFTNFRVRNNPDEDQRKADMLDLDSVRDLAEDHRTGHKFHLRHGDQSLEHIGTSSGKERWKNWLNRHKFDQAYRGHYHQHEVDSIQGDVQVIMTGSPKPPDEFEEKIAEWIAPTAYVHGVSDDQTRTFNYAIEFDN